MRRAAAAIVLAATISYDSLLPARPTRPQKYRQIGWKTISQIIGPTLNYLPTEHGLLFQVLVPSAGIRGFLDATEFGTWLKFVKRNKEKANMRHVLLGGQIFYEALRELGPGEELCLGEKQPIQLDGQDDPEKIEEDVKSILSNEEEDTNESDETGVKCLVCDKTFPDVYL